MRKYVLCLSLAALAACDQSKNAGPNYLFLSDSVCMSAEVILGGAPEYERGSGRPRHLDRTWKSIQGYPVMLDRDIPFEDVGLSIGQPSSFGHFVVYFANVESSDPSDVRQWNGTQRLFEDDIENGLIKLADCVEVGRVGVVGGPPFNTCNYDVYRHNNIIYSSSCEYGDVGGGYFFVIEELMPRVFIFSRELGCLAQPLNDERAMHIMQLLKEAANYSETCESPTEN